MAGINAFVYSLVFSWSLARMSEEHSWDFVKQIVKITSVTIHRLVYHAIDDLNGVVDKCSTETEI